MGNQQNKKKKIGIGRKILGGFLLLALGVGIGFAVAPDTMQAQLTALRELIGV